MDNGEWLRVRRDMIERRTDLAHAAAAGYPGLTIVDGTDLLVRPEWLPTRPIPLADITVEWQPGTLFDGLTGREEVTGHVRPYGYETYADAIGELVRPPIFENRTLYRFLNANLRDSATLAFGRGRYFDTINICEAVGHEYAAQGAGPLRKAVGDPTDAARRCAGVGITTLTVRLDRRAGAATFLLHWRDPGKVVHAGGLYQVVPVGIFQPSSDSPGHEQNDFDIWANIVREFNEELLGGSEDYGVDLIDYDTMPLYAGLAAGRRAGTVRPYVLGLGVDPLTFATDLLTAVIIDAPVFDELFGATVGTNAEGEIIAGTRFTDDNVDRFVHHEPMQAAGAATLRLAWRHRGLLI
jgi:hypothetical protein